MFYDNQSKENQFEYKELLALVGSLSNLFSESDEPYLSYRAHENVFCKAMNAENLARHDCSADAKKGTVGIGLKTWVGSDIQKVAEFNKLKKNFDGLDGVELLEKVAEYRNERIRITKSIYGINEMLYHVVKRQQGCMKIYEAAFDLINIDAIEIIESRTKDNCIYFTDGNHTYNFNKSKSTLYMVFDDMKLLDEIKVTISNEPYSLLRNMEINICDEIEPDDFKDSICLKLYAEDSKRGKYVPENSGLNQWHAKGRKRDPNEVYISYLKPDRDMTIGFFPTRDIPFELLLPNGKSMSAKICQDSGKAIMSNPNKELGKWLLREVFDLPEGRLLTYEMLEKCNIDSVMIKKIADRKYTIDFCELGTYDRYYFEKKSKIVDGLS